MPSIPRSKATIYVEVDPQLKADFEAFATQRGETFTAALTMALRRHMAFPPPVVELAPLPVVPKRPRGRPRKNS